jgi:D-arabinose 1-dehydrogenase-like Zn-dependent alcohol dehydrogenase
MQDINKAYGRVTSNDVKYRFVIWNHLNKNIFYLL